MGEGAGGGGGGVDDVVGGVVGVGVRGRWMCFVVPDCPTWVLLP